MKGMHEGNFKELWSKVQVKRDTIIEGIKYCRQIQILKNVVSKRTFFLTILLLCIAVLFCNSRDPLAFKHWSESNLWSRRLLGTNPLFPVTSLLSNEHARVGHFHTIVPGPEFRILTPMGKLHKPHARRVALKHVFHLCGRRKWKIKINISRDNRQWCFSPLLSSLMRLIAGYKVSTDRKIRCVNDTQARREIYVALATWQWKFFFFGFVYYDLLHTV